MKVAGGAGCQAAPIRTALDLMYRGHGLNRAPRYVQVQKYAIRRIGSPMYSTSSPPGAPRRFNAACPRQPRNESRKSNNGTLRVPDIQTAGYPLPYTGSGMI